MSLKKLLIIVIVVGLLLVIAFVKKEEQQRQQRRQESVSVAEVELIKDITDELISKIIVYKGEDENKKLIILSRKSDGQWVLENKYGLKAKKENVQNVLSQLKSLKGELRAESKDLFGDFQIQDSQAAHIILETNASKPPVHLVISYLKPEWNKNFVRLFDSEKVALVPKDILSVFQLYNKDSSPDGIFLAERKLFSFDPAAIQRIELSTPKDNFVLKRNQPQGNAAAVWQSEPPLGNNEEIDPGKVNEFLRAVSNVFVKDALDPQGSVYGFEQPTMKLTLEDTKGEKPALLVVGNLIEKEKCYFVKELTANLVVKTPYSNIQKINLVKAAFLKPQEKNQSQDSLNKQAKKK